MTTLTSCLIVSFSWGTLDEEVQSHTLDQGRVLPLGSFLIFGGDEEGISGIDKGRLVFLRGGGEDEETSSPDHCCKAGLVVISDRETVDILEALRN